MKLKILILCSAVMLICLLMHFQNPQTDIFYKVGGLMLFVVCSLVCNITSGDDN